MTTDSSVTRPDSLPAWQSHARRFGAAFLVLTALVLLALTRCDRNRPQVTATDVPAKEIAALAEAFQRYKNLYGEYPPNFSAGEDAVRRHLKYRFARIVDDEPLPPDVDAAESLVFWLGGFSSDPAHPITGPGGPLNATTQRNTGLIEFVPERLVLTSHGKQVYLPPGRGRTEPYVYFRVPKEKTEDDALAYPQKDRRIAPYLTRDNVYVDGDKFQILSAGEDDQWGKLPAPIYPAGPFTGGHADNRASFAEGILGESKSSAAATSSSETPAAK